MSIEWCVVHMCTYRRIGYRVLDVMKRTPWQVVSCVYSKKISFHGGVSSTDENIHLSKTSYNLGKCLKPFGKQQNWWLSDIFCYNDLKFAWNVPVPKQREGLGF